MEDTRNLTDELKGKPTAQIIAELDSHALPLDIAIENLQRDFNMGTIVRTANALGIRTVHVIGRRQWNKRGAMKTDTYLHIVYHVSVDAFVQAVRGRTIVAVDIVAGAQDIRTVAKPQHAVLVFGAEGPGISDELLAAASLIVKIPQHGSTRSINVAVAAGIAMWEWLRDVG